MKEILKTRFDDNFTRVNNLGNIYATKLVSAAQGRKPVGSTDILRAAVVFLHATLEEFLRGILEWQLPVQAEAILNHIPLIGGTDRPEKFLLGRLATHHHKTVDSLIRESVSASLMRSNFNSVQEIIGALGSVGLNKAPCEPFFAKLTALMERRHQIVHRADRNAHQGQGHHQASSIGRHHIQEWSQAVQDFFDAVYIQLPN